MTSFENPRHRNSTLVASFESPDNSHAWLCCHIPVDTSLSPKSQTIVYFDSRVTNTGMLKMSVFWSGLLGAEIPQAMVAFADRPIFSKLLSIPVHSQGRDSAHL